MPTVLATRDAPIFSVIDRHIRACAGEINLKERRELLRVNISLGGVTLTSRSRSMIGVDAPITDVTDSGCDDTLAYRGHMRPGAAVAVERARFLRVA
jgi:hypothetical protein